MEETESDMKGHIQSLTGEEEGRKRERENKRTSMIEGTRKG